MEFVTLLLAVVVGGAVSTASAYLQHRWTAKREDLRRAEEARADRIQLERDAIADLIVALYDYVSSVVNLKYAYDRAGAGAQLDVERVRQIQDEGKAFGPALVRARLTVRNPAARPALDDLHVHHVRMSSHLSLAALGQSSPNFVAYFEEFHRDIGEARVALEQAALTYDGAPNAEKPQPAAVKAQPRQRPSSEADAGAGAATSR